MVNKVIVVGNLGRDAELRYTPGGQAVASFSVAATEKWKDRNGQLQERTEWIRIVLWGKVAEALSEYLVKGKQVYLEGKLQTRKWTDRSGAERYTTEVRADVIRLLGGGKANGSKPARNAAPIDTGGFDEAEGIGDFNTPEPAASDMGSSEWPGEDDIPF